MDGSPATIGNPVGDVPAASTFTDDGSAQGGAPSVGSESGQGGVTAPDGSAQRGGAPSSGDDTEMGGTSATTDPADGGVPSTDGRGGASGGTGGMGTVELPTGGASGSSGGSGAAGLGSGMAGSAMGGSAMGGSAPGGVEEPVVLDPDALYAAPDGVAGAPGTSDEPTTLADAVGRVNAGETIYLRGGTYRLATTIELGRDGTEAAPIQLRAYPLDDTRPLLDFSAMPEGSNGRGLSLSGDYWHLYGLDVFAAGDNCLFVGGAHNVIEFATFSECADTGLQLGNGASDNLVLNCDSFFNADASLENADGFAAKLDVGTGNRFVGCRAWNNLDDGWDGYLRPADGVTTTHENCWAIDNGKLKDGSVGVGDGNGFKTGGSDGKDLRHHAIYQQCIATGNVNDGFDHNSNRGDVTILNSAAHDNGRNLNFGTTNIAASLTVKNTLSLGINGELSATRTDLTNNGWQGGLSVTSDDFVSVDSSQLKGPRKSDGSLPDIDYLHLAPGSDLRNAGVDVGLPYAGAAPDVGPFESDE